MATVNLPLSGQPDRTPGPRRNPGTAVTLASMPGTERIPYDEFGMFHENAEEFGIRYEGPPTVRRESMTVGSGRTLSALVWGSADAELAFLHGGAQNAHTWDTVALALDRPLVAVDLPGHGHSDGSPLGPLGVEQHAADVADVVEAFAPNTRAVVGMSLGGLTSIALAGSRPDLVRRLILVDVTPGVNRERSQYIADFINGPPSFPSFDDLLARTIEYNPTRSVSSLRRGILHNAVQQEDGTWVWRHARWRPEEPAEPPQIDFDRLWDVVGQLTMPVLLVRGMAKGTVVGDEDEAELMRRLPNAEVVRVEGAGHSVQGDKPIELAHIIEAFAF